MAAIYLEHPKHGQKVCSTDAEAKIDRENGWTDFEPTPTKGDLPDFLSGPVDSSDLAEDFPGREALSEAGLLTWASIVGKTKEELMSIKGIGDSTATKILNILNG